NILIKNVTLLPMGEKIEPIENTNIYIVDKKIEHIGYLRGDIKVDKIIDGKGKVALPGLINAHTHIAMSLLRNYADDVPLHKWLTEKIWPVEAKLKAEDIYWGSMLSIVEMIQSGVTCFSDMYFFMDEVGKAVEESGIRGVLSRGLIEESGDNSEAINNEKLEDTKNLYNNWNGKADGRLKVMVAPHAPYTCGPSYIEKIMKLADELGAGIHIHLSETRKEVEDSFNQFNKSPIKHVHDLGLFKYPTLAAHCVHVSDEDIEILSENNVAVVNNPG